ncbi:heme biosynthesis protein HemY [Cardiobacteriaceae bacterium TAE3-ERU3]|nr:heme biosynthesis protein HemY [Cardiobacteriaceae bacterium TAE3-ERU3]
MFRFFLALIIISLCAVTGYFIKTFPAVVALRLPDYTITTNLIIWCILSLIAAWVITLIVRLFVFLWRSPQYFSRSAEVRKRKKAHDYLQNGLAELISGHYSKAEKYFVRGGDLADEIGESSVIYFENAAIAADYLNADERRERYLLNARQHAHSKQHTALTRLNEAEMHIDHGDHDKAIPLLEEIRDQESKNVKVLSLLEQAYADTGDWESGWRILPKLKGYMKEDDYKARQKFYAKGLLKDTPSIESVYELETAWRALPADMRKEQEMVLLYASALAENGHNDAAEHFLNQEIKRSQNLDLIQAYSQMRSGNFKAQLANMQRWEKEHPNDAVFLYAKALIAYKANDYDTAGQAIEESIKRHPSKEAFALWAQILEAKDQPEAALAAYRQSVVSVAVDETLSGDLLPATQDQKAISS